jgi:hypothetical protein
MARPVSAFFATLATLLSLVLAPAQLSHANENDPEASGAASVEVQSEDVNVHPLEETSAPCDLFGVHLSANGSCDDVAGVITVTGNAEISGTSSSPVKFDVSNGANLTFNAGIIAITDRIVTTGDITFASGTINFSDPWSANMSTDTSHLPGIIYYGNVNSITAANVTFSGAAINFDMNGVTLPAGQSLVTATETLSVSGGSVAFAGNGAILGENPYLLKSSGDMTFSAGSVDVTLTNSGTSRSWTGGCYPHDNYIGSSSSITISGTAAVSVNVGISGSSSWEYGISAPTLNVTGGSLTTNNAIGVDNGEISGGSINVGSSLDFGSEFVVTGGTVTGNVNSDSGDLIVGSGGTVNGPVSAGIVTNNGSVTGDISAGAIFGTGTGPSMPGNPSDILATPTNLQVDVNSIWGFTVTWNEVASATRYWVKITGGNCDIDDKNVAEATYTFTGNCETDSDISVEVRAGGVTNNLWSVSPVADTFGQPSVIPASAVQNIQILKAADDTVRVTWDAPSDLGSPAMNAYVVDLGLFSTMCSLPATDRNLSRVFVCTGTFSTYNPYSVDITPVYIDPLNDSNIIAGNTNSEIFSISAIGSIPESEEEQCTIDGGTWENYSCTTPSEEICIALGSPWEWIEDECVDTTPPPALTPCQAGYSGDFEPDCTLIVTPCPDGYEGTGSSVEGNDCTLINPGGGITPPGGDGDPETPDPTTPGTHGAVPLSDALKALGAYIDEDGTIHVPTGVAIPLTVIEEASGNDIAGEFTFTSTSAPEYTAYDIIDNDANTITFTHASPHSVAGTAANRADVAFVFEVFDAPQAGVLGNTGVQNNALLNFILLLLIAGLGAGLARQRA